MWKFFSQLFTKQQPAQPDSEAEADSAKRGKFERHPLNVPGPFYVVNGDCMTCCLAEAEAPDLIESAETHGHCYFKKQPETPDEISVVAMAMRVSEVAAHRYAGSDPVILRRLRALGCESHCDQRLAED